MQLQIAVNEKTSPASKASNNGWTPIGTTVLIAIVCLLTSIAPAWARGRSESRESILVPPPPPTPVLTMAPPPVVLPYSYAMSGYQPGAIGGSLTPERWIQPLLAPSPSHQVSRTKPTEWAPYAGTPQYAGTPRAARLVPYRPALNAAPALNPSVAKARGFGSARIVANMSGPGGAMAQPRALSKHTDPWHDDACFGWYIKHATGRDIAALDQNSYPETCFHPAWPASLNGASPLQAIPSMDPYRPPEPKTKPSEASTQTQSNMHMQTFRHRRRVIANR